MRYSWLVFVALGLAVGSARGIDVDVYTKDGKTLGPAKLIAEDIRGMTVQVRGKDEQLIAAEDIDQVTYYLQAVARLDFRKPFTTERQGLGARGDERKKLLEEARDAFAQLGKTALAESRDAHRYLLFKEAETLAHLAEADPARRDEAIKALQEFHKSYSDGWQVVPALKLQASLLEAKKDTEGAAKTYEELTKIPGVPEDVKRRGEVLVAQLYIRSGQFGRAETKLGDLYKGLSDNDPQRGFVAVYLAQAQLNQDKTAEVEKLLREALGGSAEAKVRALAHNFLGDYYLKAKKPERAFWEYLKVDMLYPDDAEEHAKAMHHLSTLFDSVKNDKVRAEAYAEKLQDPRYAASPYHKPAEPKK